MAERYRDAEKNIHYGPVALVTMACCGFTFDAMHTDRDGGYTCPICDDEPLTAAIQQAEAAAYRKAAKMARGLVYEEQPDYDAEIQRGGQRGFVLVSTRKIMGIAAAIERLGDRE